MAIAYVRDTGGQTGSDIDTDTASFASLPAVGNSVFVLASMWHGANNHFAAGQVTDNQSNSYAMDLEAQATDAVTDLGIYSCVDIGSPSGTFTLTLNPAGSNNAYVEWIGVEFSGLADSSVLDQVNSVLGTSTTPSVTSGTTTQANELVLGCFAETGASVIGIDLPAGYTQLHLNDSSTDTIGHLSAYKIVSATGTQNFNVGTVSISVPPGAWAIGVATYKTTAPDNIYPAQEGVILQAVNRGAFF